MFIALCVFNVCAAMAFGHLTKDLSFSKKFCAALLVAPAELAWTIVFLDKFH